MSKYFSMIFEVHCMVFRYMFALKNTWDLSPRSISGTTSEDTEPMRRTKRSGREKKLK